MVFFLYGTLLHSQEINISGQVTDTSGESLPGVSVVIKGTNTGVATDRNGDYSIQALTNDTLSFSFIGHQTRVIPISGRQKIDVKMPPQSVELKETVVTALGITQAEKAVGYSIQEIAPEQLEKGGSGNIGNLLTGKVAGLNVSNPSGLFQAPDFSLRGKDPLVVIDNMPVKTDLWELHPDDIANVNVLKGTTASALYGSRGRNGAILITTKNASKEGMSIEFSNTSMFSAGYTSFPETQNEYGNGSNGQYEFWDGKDGGISDGDMIWGPKFEEGVKIPQWNSPIRDKETGETIPWYGNVTGTQYDDKSRYERVPIPWEHHDNLKNFLRTGYISKTNLAINYKNDRVALRMSTNYSDQKGQVPNTSMKTGGLKINMNYQLLPGLSLDTKVGYNKIYSPNSPRYGYGPKNHIYTWLVWMGDDVDGQDLKDHQWVPGLEGYRQANWNYAWYNNPYFSANKLNQEYNQDQYQGQFGVNWEINDQFSLHGNLSALRKTRFQDRESPKSYLNYGDPRDGDYKTWNRDWVNVDNDLRLTYRNQLGPALNLTINAGGAAFYHKFENYYSATDGLIVPGVYSLNNTKNNVKASTYVQEKAVRSVYGTVDLDVIDAIFLTFAGRNDWSSALPASNDSYFYPSVSLSTMASDLIQMPQMLDYLKFFGSWAQVSADLAPPAGGNPYNFEGRMNIANMAGYGNPYQMQSYYANAGNFGSNTMLTYPGGIVNPNIKPEKSTSYEAGLSSSFFSNRVGVDLTYYNVVDENQIIDLPVSESTGFNSRKVNGNEYTTEGIEILLKTSPLRSPIFNWDMAVNVDHRVKRLTGIYGGEEKFGNYSLNERVDNHYASGWMKTPQGQVILNEDTGLPVRDPYPQMFGHREPDFRFGLSNTFSYNNFTLNLDFDGAWGGIMRSLTVEKMWWGGKHPESTTYRDAEYAAGEPVYVPEGVNVVSGELTRDTEGNVVSDTRQFKENQTAVSWQTWSQNYPYRAAVNEEESEKFANLLDRSFVKLRRAALSYDLSDLIQNSNTIKGAEVSLVGYNLWMYKKAIIIDPDFGNDSELQDPSTRYVGMDINLKF